MIDFNKKLIAGKTTKKTDPIELYDTLDRKSVAGPLRPAQEYILKDWYLNHRTEKDIIIKLHTGEGKTLRELKPYSLNDTTDITLQRLIDTYKLNMINFVDDYSENYYHKSK